MGAKSDRSFVQLGKEIFRLYELGAYQSALRLTMDIADRYPEEAQRTSFWKACLYSRLDQTEKAIHTLAAALDAGHWWSESMLRSDPDLAPLQGLPEFERLMPVFIERHKAAQAKAYPTLITRFPGEAYEPPHPLLIVLHGRAGNAKASLEHWENLAGQGWMVALPQSSQLFGPESYSWDDETAAQEEIISHYNTLLARQPVDIERVVLAGYSQGGGLAIRLALKQDLPVRGFLAVVPSFNDWERFESQGLALSAVQIRGYLVVGEEDPRTDRLIALHAKLNALDVACELESHPDLGHAYPDYFEHSLDRGLRFILSG